MFDLLLHLYVQKRTTLNTWVEEKSSKSIHLKKNNFSNLDYIFIGSSRTIFHISTNYFKNRGMDIYNFGVSGAELVDFPYMVARSLKEKPQNIIISLSVNSLYQGSNIGSYESLTYEDLGFIYKSQPMRIKAEATKAYLKTIHKILVYSNPIYLRISQL